VIAPCSWVRQRKTSWMRGPFLSDKPAGRIMSITSAVGASRTASHVGKRARSWSKALSRSESEVFWLRIVHTSSSTGGKCCRQVGNPYVSARIRAICWYLVRRPMHYDSIHITRADNYR
jgi:hypothetical protein